MTEPSSKSPWRAGKRERLAAIVVAVAATASALALILAPPHMDSGKRKSSSPEQRPAFTVPERPTPKPKPPVAKASPPDANAHSPEPVGTTKHGAQASRQARAAGTKARKPVSRPGKRVVKNTPPAHGYYVQAGAFRDRKRARALARRLAKSGWKTRIIPKPAGLSAVVIGPWNTSAKAGNVRKQLMNRQHIKGFVIHL